MGEVPLYVAGIESSGEVLMVLKGPSHSWTLFAPMAERVRVLARNLEPRPARPGRAHLRMTLEPLIRPHTWRLAVVLVAELHVSASPGR